MGENWKCKIEYAFFSVPKHGKCDLVTNILEKDLKIIGSLFC